MRVTDCMRRDVAVLDPRDSIAQAGRLLAEGVGAIPVVRRSALVRMLSAAEVALAQPSAATTFSLGEIKGRLAQTSIEAIPSREVTAVGPRTALTEAIRLMRVRRLGVLPVVRGEELLGVLTEEDLLDLLGEIAEMASD